MKSGHVDVSEAARYTVVYMYVWSHIQQEYVDQPGKVANPVRGQLNSENQYFPEGSSILNIIELSI